MRSIKTITNEALFNSSAYITGIVLVAGSAIATITLDDSDDGTGTGRVALKCPINDSRNIFLGDRGVKFISAVYSTISGSGAVAYIYYR